MAEPFAARSLLTQRCTDPWLIGQNSQQFWNQVNQRITTLERQPSIRRVFVMESDPVAFLAGFFAGCAAERTVFLGNPGWSVAEKAAAVNIAQPDIIWGDASANLAPPQPNRASDWLNNVTSAICIPTGGTSGHLRFVVHTWETLLASVWGMQGHFKIDTIHSCCVLPLYHVSGLMQAVRSLITGGSLTLVPSKDLAADLPSEFKPSLTFLSLVPTQLQRYLDQPSLVAKLADFRAILLGGAPAWSNLLHRARQYGLPLAPTYGMTETASQVVTLHPDAFLAGVTHLGRSLPHAHLQIVNAEGQRLAPCQIGNVQIQSKSLFLGYFPGEKRYFHQLITGDLGYLDAAGNLTVVGRSSDLIITGGENVYPAEVEAAILATGLVADVVVVGQPDPTWGEAVTAVYVPGSQAAMLDAERAIVPLLRQTLSPFKIPKRWIAQSHIPRNAQGKLNRAALWHRIDADTSLPDSPLRIEQ